MLDSVGYLTSFGWQGKGNGLRQDSTSRPLSIPQKRTLAGVGKDRDEAFPFWDHLFAAAAKSIRIKVSGDADEETQNGTPLLSESSFLRTTTGILSNRRPISGTPASSGTVTPSEVDQRHSIPRLSLLATAKRESARKMLYAGFFRGPVLGPEPEYDPRQMAKPIATITDTIKETRTAMTMNYDVKTKYKKRKHEDHELGDGVQKMPEKMRRDACLDVTIVKEPRKKKRKNLEDREKSREEETVQIAQRTKRIETAEERSQRKAAKAERRRRKEERRKRKKEKKEKKSGP